MAVFMRLVYGLTFALIAGYSFSGDYPSFAKLDSNQDGKISMLEAKANAKVMDKFNRFDTDGDLLLSEGEYRQLINDQD